jgi:hypothetical protein
MPKTYKERKEEKIKKQKEAEESAKRNEADHQKRLAIIAQLSTDGFDANESVGGVWVKSKTPGKTITKEIIIWSEHGKDEQKTGKFTAVYGGGATIGRGDIKLPAASTPSEAVRNLEAALEDINKTLEKYGLKFE